jgi:hypothetical protein
MHPGAHQDGTSAGTKLEIIFEALCDDEYTVLSAVIAARVDAGKLRVRKSRR